MGSGGSLRGRPRPYPSPRSLPGRSLVATWVMKHPATGSHALGLWPPPLAPNPKPGPPGHAGSPALRPQPPVTITPIALPRRHSRGPASCKERRRTQGGGRAGPRPCRCSPPLRAAALAPELARAALLSLRQVDLKFKASQDKIAIPYLKKKAKNSVGGCLSSPDLVLKSLGIPRELLVFHAYRNPKGGQEELDRQFRRLFGPLKFDYRDPDFIEKVVSYLPTALRKRKDDFVDSFLAVYPAFATTRKVLALITDKIMCGSPDADFLEDFLIKRNILDFLIDWMQKVPQDFRMAPDRAILKRLLDYLYQDFPQVFPRLRVQRLLSQLEAQKSTETPEEDEEATDRGFRWTTTSLALIPDATEMQEKLHPSPPSVAGPPGDLTPKEDTESADSATGGPTLPEDGPGQLKDTSVDSVHIIIRIQTHEYIPAVVPVFPLPDVDV
uniref:uncharacterized protein LOC125389747 n=1 Tax=Myodes glareolus TaxID=447135 RepID=UPI002020B809|nr:uncharacterized protein LOC125389747 [Myodes glareolus]